MKPTTEFKSLINRVIAYLLETLRGTRAVPSFRRRGPPSIEHLLSIEMANEHLKGYSDGKLAENTEVNILYRFFVTLNVKKSYPTFHSPNNWPPFSSQLRIRHRLSIHKDE